jgi:hypothetical protein
MLVQPTDLSHFVFALAHVTQAMALLAGIRAYGFVGAGWIGLGCDMVDALFEGIGSMCAAYWWSMEQGWIVVGVKDCSEGGVVEEN